VFDNLDEGLLPAAPYRAQHAFLLCLVDLLLGANH